MRRAVRDGYGIDRIYDASGGYAEVRRRVIAGQPVPGNLHVDPSLFEPVAARVEVVLDKPARRRAGPSGASGPAL